MAGTDVTLSGPPRPAGRHLYPVVLDVTDQPCLVVGGGRLAARRAGELLDCGASVTAVAPAFDPAFDQLAVTRLARPYQPGEAAGFRLVITTTGVPEVDGAVYADAHGAGVWVNSVDDTAHCSFHLPSVHRDGPVTVAVSSGGTSPALSKWLRRKIEVDAGLGPELGSLASLLAEARRQVMDEGRPTSAVDWRELLDGQLLPLVRAGRWEDARSLLAGATRPPPT